MSVESEEASPHSYCAYWKVSFFTIYKRVSCYDNETFRYQISNTVFSGLLSMVILWTANDRFHVSASFYV
jgi:hypothetical protein